MPLSCSSTPCNTLPSLTTPPKQHSQDPPPPHTHAGTHMLVFLQTGGYNASLAGSLPLHGLKNSTATHVSPPHTHTHTRTPTNTHGQRLHNPPDASPAHHTRARSQRPPRPHSSSHRRRYHHNGSKPVRQRHPHQPQQQTARVAQQARHQPHRQQKNPANAEAGDRTRDQCGEDWHQYCLPPGRLVLLLLPAGAPVRKCTAVQDGGAEGQQCAPATVTEQHLCV